jgi:hypothetical protein
MKMDSMETGHRKARSGGRSSSQRTRVNSRSRRSSSRSSARTGSAKRRTLSNKRRSTQGTRSRGTKRAQPSRGGAAKSTTDLNEIRRWAEERGGKPVSVAGTAKRGEAGLLRIDFPGYTGADRLQEISWDGWYEKFNESKLKFLYQEKPESRFFKLVSRGSSGQRRPSGKQSRSKKRSTSAK